MNREETSETIPDWLQPAIDYLRATSAGTTAEQIAECIHEALRIIEAEKYATAESRFSFTLIGANEDDLARIRKHLTPFENSILEIKRKEER